MERILTKAAFLPRDGVPLVISRINEKAYVGEVTPHRHEFNELVIITRGSGMHVTPQEIWPIAAGDVFVIKGEQSHGYTGSVNLQLINILYDAAWFDLHRQDLQGLPGYHAMFTLEPDWRARRRFSSRLGLSLAELTHVDSLVTSMEDELRTRAPGYQLMTRAQFMQLVGFLSRCYSHCTTPARRDLVRLAEAISYLETHYDREIYVEKLAAIAHMSRRNFLRVFKDAMGVTPVEHLSALRIARAAQLLREGRCNITEAAFKSGFEDSNYFARQFRKAMRMSPRQYLKQNRSK